MDILNILNGIKGKVLDAAHFDLLRSAYDLQNENVDQLKSNNSALRESNILLKDRVDRLEKDVARLQAENADLRERCADRSAVELEYRPEGVAKEILLLYRRMDDHLLFDRQAASALQKPQLEIEAAFSELKEAKVVRWGLSGEEGAGYFLTEAGNRLVLTLEPD